jgi:hypothetical protein
VCVCLYIYIYIYIYNVNSYNLLRLYAFEIIYKLNNGIVHFLRKLAIEICSIQYFFLQ